MRRLWFCTMNFMCGMILFYNLFMIKVYVQNQNPFGIDGDYITFSIRDTSNEGLPDTVSVYIKELAEGNEKFFMVIENREFYTTDIYDGRTEKNRMAISQWIGEYTIGYLSEENMKDLEALVNTEGTNYKIHKSNERIAEIFQSIWNNRNYKNMFLGTMIVCVVYMQYIKLVINKQKKEMTIWFLCGADRVRCIFRLFQKKIWQICVSVLLSGIVTQRIFAYAIEGKSSGLILGGSILIVCFLEIIYLFTGLHKFTKIIKNDWSNVC